MVESTLTHSRQRKEKGGERKVKTSGRKSYKSEKKRWKRLKISVEGRFGIRLEGGQKKKWRRRACSQKSEERRIMAEQKRRMRKENIKTVGGLLVSMEVNNENLMTWGLQESVPLSSLLLPFSSSSSSPLPVPLLADSLFSFPKPFLPFSQPAHVWINPGSIYIRREKTL